MSATITLPSPLRTRLAAIQRRIRLLRLLRGFALLVVVLTLSAAAAVLADYWLDLPALTRQVLFSVWLAEAAGLLLLGVTVPVCRRTDAAALAAVIEEKYPDLGERLTSAVELAGVSGEGHGSPLFIGLLLEETAARSERLDFRPAVPARRAGVLAALAAAIVLLSAAPAFVWPQQYRDLTQRFFRPWNVPPAAPPYDIAVSPGDIIAARGRSVLLSAHLTPRDEKIVLPDAATLLVVEAGGKETRQAMPRAENGDFTLAYKVSGDVSYRIEAGEVVSDSYRVTAITPVELAAENPRITITPPAYARSVKDEETFHGLVDLSPLQYSEIRFDFRFTRPAVAGYLEWIVASGGHQPPVGEEQGANAPRSPASANIRTHPLILSADRQAASLTIPAMKEGKYRLILEAEHDIRTELPGGTIHVQPDQPPSVRRFAAKEELRAVLPYERIPLEIEAVDDIGVAGVELEYHINDGETVRQPLDLQGGNTPSAVARHVLELAGKVQEDDRVSYRFRVSDNLPKQYQGPHVIVYPADRWLTLRIARHGNPLQQQEIRAQRDDIKRRLQAIHESLLQEKRGVYQVRQETRNPASLAPDPLDSVKQLQHQNRADQRALREVAQAAEATPSLQAVAERARDVADGELHKSQQALEQAAREASPAERTRQFDKAGEQLASAVKRLEELLKTNDRLAQQRLDRAKLEMLADREKHLAEQTAELAAKHPVLDPKARELAEKIKREHAEAAGELERLSQQSEPLKQALEQARQEQSRQLAERARELAQAQRDLARAEEQTQRQHRANRLAELARQQQELAENEAKLARQTRQAAEAAKTRPLKPEEAQRAAEALKQANPQQAVKHQDQAIRDLDRLAQALDQVVKRDPRDTSSAKPRSLPSQEQSDQARQLARQQHELRDAVQRAAQTTRSERPVVRDNPIEELSRKQAEVAKQAAELARKVGQEQGAEATASRRASEAHQAAQQAAAKMQAGALPQAQQAGQRSAEQLRQLAAQLARTPRRGGPQAPDALQQARQLGQRQEDINRRLQPLAGDARAQAAQQQARQRDLQQETGALRRQFQQLAQQLRTSGPMQSALQRAAGNSQQAEQAMQQAREQAQRGESAAEQQSQERAAQALEQATRAASEAAKPSAPASAKSASPTSDSAKGRTDFKSVLQSKAGEAVAKAGQQMAAAQGQLHQGQPAQAQAAMRQAAQALAQAAQQMAANPANPPRQQGQPGQPIGLGRLPGGLPDLSAYGLDKTAYTGKTWGELPGELRTKIVQDMKARYGEDYARMIKYYFEHIADTKKK